MQSSPPCRCARLAFGTAVCKAGVLEDSRHDALPWLRWRVLRNFDADRRASISAFSMCFRCYWPSDVADSMTHVQGGPHNHQIAALCVALKHCRTSEFVEYQKQVVRNAQALAKRLTGSGYKMATGGSDNHLILWDLRDQGVTGSKMQAMCDAAHITLNMNSVAGDVSAMTPGWRAHRHACDDLARAQGG